MEPNNSPNYRGSYNPFLSNCIKVQQNWELFKVWMARNYKPKEMGITITNK